MTNDERKAWGEQAIAAGSPDFTVEDTETNAVDTIANILHAIDAAGVGSVVERAQEHYYAEVSMEALAGGGG